MKNWLRKKLYNFLHQDNDISITSKDIAMSSNDVDMDNSIRFHVMPARGGVIVQTRVYDHKKDEHKTTTHIIPEGEDIAERVGQIVSIEMLSH